MQQIFKNLISLGIFAITFGLLIECFLYLQMTDRRAHVLEDWEDIIGLDEEVWFLGDSRTSTHINPVQIELKSNRSVYNLGYDGFRIGMGVKRVNFALHHAESPPKYIVVQSDISYIDTRRVQSNFPMKDGMLRYFWSNQIGINTLFSDYENWRGLDAWVPLLRYKGYPLMFFKHLLGWNRWDKRASKGYWNHIGSVGGFVDSKPTAQPQQLTLMGLDSVAAHHNIQVIGLIPPSAGGQERPPLSLLDSLMPGELIWDFSFFLDDIDTNYFKDSKHFSPSGVELYSDSIASLVNNLH